VLHEGAKFLIVGLIGIGVTNLVFIPLHGPLGLGPLKSITIATIVATAVTFLGNRYWSFRHREGAGTAKEGVTFVFLNGIGLLIQYAVLGFSNYALGLTTKIENVIAVNLGIGLGTLFRFWSYRTHVFKIGDESDEEPASLSFAAALADVPDGEENDAQASLELEDAAVEPRLVVTSSAEGSVVIRIVESAAEIDEIDLDARARASS